MINSYADVKFTTGNYAAGLFKVLIAPREWLKFPIVRNFNTGLVDTVELKNGFQFLELGFTPDTYEYDEKPKTGKNGTYFDTSLLGTDNNITPEALLILETFRNHEMIAILYDNRKRKKVVGNQDNGMLFSFANKEYNSQGGLQICDITMTMQSETAAPFFIG